MSTGVMPELIGNSVMKPVGVIRPILADVSSVNQRLWSGPAAIESGCADAVGSGYSVATPAVVMAPMLLLPASVNQTRPSEPSDIPPMRTPGGNGKSVIAPAV